MNVVKSYVKRGLRRGVARELKVETWCCYFCMRVKGERTKRVNACPCEIKSEKKLLLCGYSSEKEIN
jgi:hypothetical protein